MFKETSGRVTIVEGDKKYIGDYSVKNEMISVVVMNGAKSTQLGSSQPEVMAKSLLRELINEGKAADSL